MNRLALIFSIISLCASHPLQAFWSSSEEKMIAKQEYALLAFGKKLGKQYDMEFQNWGAGTIVDSPLTAYDLNFIARGKLMTLEQVRPLAFQMTKAFLNELYSNPLHIKMLAVHPFNTHVGPERIGIKVTFWDANVDRPLAPYVAQVKVVDGKIHYYYANPKDQSLQEPPALIETFDEIFSRMGEAMPTPPVKN